MAHSILDSIEGIDTNKLEIFNEVFLRTKVALLSDIDTLMANDPINGNRSRAYFDRYHALLSRFRDRIQSCVFPEKLEDWWYYTYEVLETGAVLHLVHAGDVDLSSEGFIDSVFIDTSFDLITVNAEMMTVEQYARENGVTTTAVRQWIRRGKIKTAVKYGSEWRIPELAEVSSRGYSQAVYRWTDYLTDLPEEYTYLNDFNFVSIMQNHEHKTMFEVFFSKDENTKTLQLETKDKEKLELYLITNPFIHPESGAIVKRG